MLDKIIAALLALGPFGILVIAVVDSVGIPMPAAMDFLLVTIAVKKPQDAYFAALMAVLGSTGGNVALFLAARHGGKWLLKGGPSSSKAQRFQQWFQRYGLLTVFIPAVTPVVPFPLKVFVVSAGVLRTSFTKFLAIVVVARVIRYFGEAYLGLHLGADATAFLQRNAWSLLGVALLMAMGLYLLIRVSDRRGASVL